MAAGLALLALVALATMRPRVPEPAAVATPVTPAREPAAADTWGRSDAPDGDWAPSASPSPSPGADAGSKP